MSLDAIQVVTQPLTESIFDEEMHQRAKWSLGRFIVGKKKLKEQHETERERLVKLSPKYQELVKKGMEKTIIFSQLERELSRDALDNVLESLKNANKLPKRQFQLIYKDDILTEIATLSHVIIDRRVVKQLVDKVLIEEFKLQAKSPFDYENYSIGLGNIINTKLGKLQVGLGVDYGNNILRNAIKFSTYIEIQVCTNPLSFLQIHGTMGTSLAVEVKRVLRLQTKNEITIQEKITESAKEVFQINQSIPKILEQNGKQLISNYEAKATLRAMFSAYNLNNKQLISNIYEDIGNVKELKVWDLAMTISEYAKTGESFKDGTKYQQARLSAVALVYLTTNELDKVIQNSLTYVKDKGINVLLPP